MRRGALALVIHHFGSKDGLRKACDDYVAEEIRSRASRRRCAATIPATWFAAMARSRSYAPLMSHYLVRTMEPVVSWRTRCGAR